MNNKASIYVDVDKCSKWDVLGETVVYLNGRKVKKAVAAKLGVNGYVEYYLESNKKNYFKAVKQGMWPTEKKRGNVKVVFSHAVN